MGEETNHCHALFNRDQIPAGSVQNAVRGAESKTPRTFPSLVRGGALLGGYRRGRGRGKDVELLPEPFLELLSSAHCGTLSEVLAALFA